MSEDEIIDQLDRIAGRELTLEEAVDSATEAAEFIVEFAATPQQLDWVIDRYRESSAIQIVQGLIIALARTTLQTSLLHEWSKLFLAIQKYWKRAPEMMGTALSLIDSELRALYGTSEPINADFSILLPSLIEDCLRIEDLPRARDDIFLGAIGIVDTLVQQDLLSGVYSNDRRSDLALQIIAIIVWLEARGPFYVDEAASARVLVRELQKD